MIGRPTAINEIQVSDHDKDQIREFLLFQKEISEVVSQLATRNTDRANGHGENDGRDGQTDSV
jgi:hypothetical protein